MTVPDSGKTTIFFAVAVAGIMAIIGLSVDGAGQLRALLRADNIAAEAARAGGQAIDGPQAIVGGAKVLDPDAAVAAANDYLAAAGATGTVTVAADRQHLAVSATVVYQPLFLGWLGIGPREVTGSATGNLIVG